VVRNGTPWIFIAVEELIWRGPNSPAGRTSIFWIRTDATTTATHPEVGAHDDHRPDKSEDRIPRKVERQEPTHMRMHTKQTAIFRQTRILGHAGDVGQLTSIDGMNPR
jgi:hypothetical protein